MRNYENIGKMYEYLYKFMVLLLKLSYVYYLLNRFIILKRKIK